MTEPVHLAYCRGCNGILSPAVEDPTWPGFCADCVNTGTPVLRVLRDPYDQPHPTTPPYRREICS